MTNYSEHAEAVFYNISYEVALIVFVVWCAHIFSREDALELEKTCGWVIRFKQPIDAEVH